MAASLQENVTLITEINELRKELQTLRGGARSRRGATEKPGKRPKSADLH